MVSSKTVKLRRKCNAWQIRIKQGKPRNSCCEHSDAYEFHYVFSKSNLVVGLSYWFCSSNVYSSIFWPRILRINCLLELHIVASKSAITFIANQIYLHFGSINYPAVAICNDLARLKSIFEVTDDQLGVSLRRPLGISFRNTILEKEHPRALIVNCSRLLAALKEQCIFLFSFKCVIYWTGAHSTTIGTVSRWHPMEIKRILNGSTWVH